MQPPRQRLEPGGHLRVRPAVVSPRQHGGPRRHAGRPGGDVAFPRSRRRSASGPLPGQPDDLSLDRLQNAELGRQVLGPEARRDHSEIRFRRAAVAQPSHARPPFDQTRPRHLAASLNEGRPKSVQGLQRLDPPVLGGEHCSDRDGEPRESPSSGGAQALGPRPGGGQSSFDVVLAFVVDPQRARAVERQARRLGERRPGVPRRRQQFEPAVGRRIEHRLESRSQHPRRHPGGVVADGRRIGQDHARAFLRQDQGQDGADRTGARHQYARASEPSHGGQATPARRKGQARSAPIRPSAPSSGRSWPATSPR